tara:strand:+ start:1281 stop:2285 length:1005 start_codon:yes stop_codon:yes gene_type:complete
MPLSKIVANSIADDTITTDQIADTSINGRRNLIINPSGAVDQRGGSSTINTYSVDRWRSYGGPGGFTISKRTDAGEGDGNAIRFHRTASNSQTSAMGIAQGLETIESKRLAGKTVTISFRARKGADWSPTNFDAKLFHGTGTDENPVGMTGQASDIAVDDASLTTSFQTFVGNVTIPSNKTQVTLGFQWTPSGTAGANDYVDIREIQMEVGEVSSPVFEHRSFSEELNSCLRYYHTSNIGNPDGSLTGAATGIAFDANEVSVCYEFPVPMRATPTITLYDNAGNSARVHRMRSGDHSNATSASLINKTGFANFASTGMAVNGGYLGGVEADAEL